MSEAAHMQVTCAPSKNVIPVHAARARQLLSSCVHSCRSRKLASFMQVLTMACVSYMVSVQIVHRDVKLENILLDSANHIKLIDFGLAANTMPGRKLKVHCGSPSYAAPEIVARRLYDGPPVDVWSLGVVLYGMICGHLPFHATDNKKVRQT